MRDNLAVVVTVSASLLVAVRLLAVANLDAITALAILQDVGPANVLLGTLLSVLPFLVTLGWAGAALVALTSDDGRRKAFTWVGLALFALSFFLTPWPILVAAVAAFGMEWLRRRRLRRLRRRTSPRLLTTTKWAGLILDCVFVMYAAVTILLIQPWLAPELVTTGDGKTLVAFVLSDNQGQVALLRESDRQIIYLDTALESRQICAAAISPFDGPSLYRLLSGDQPYRSCPND